MTKGKYKNSINSSKAISLIGDNSKVGVATSLWGIFSEFTLPNDNNDSFHTHDQLNISSLHPSFVPIFTNISKKDSLTRLKGLILFKEELSLYLQDKNLNINWDPILSNFTYIYIRVGVYDSDTKIRKLSNECFLLLHNIVGGKKLEKYCKLFFPALWLSCSDPKPDVSKSAIDCLEGLIGKENEDRIVKIIDYSSSSLFDLYGRLLSCNIKNIKNELNANVSSLSEEEELFDRLISTCLASLKKIIDILHKKSFNNSFNISSHIIFNSYPEKLKEFNEFNNNDFSWNTLQMGSIWKFISKSYSSVIRVEAIQLLTSSMNIIFHQIKKYPILENSFVNYVPSLSRLFVEIMQCIGDHLNSNVQIVSPKLLLIFLKLFPGIWEIQSNKLFVSPINYFKKIIFSCLNKPNQLSCDSLYSELPYIIASVPFKIILEEIINYQQFTDNLINEEFNEITQILNQDQFYFQSFNQLLLLIHSHIQSNDLPFIILFPFTIISPMLKFNLNHEKTSTSQIQNKITINTSNLNLFTNSIKTYYTILLFFLFNKFNTIEENYQDVKNFLIKFYSKIIWNPIIISLTFKDLHNIQNSINCSKARDKINEKFFNIIINSINSHEWVIKECKIRQLELSLHNLESFLKNYWEQSYINNHLKIENYKIYNLYYIETYLKICSTFNQYNPHFLNCIVILCINSIQQDIFLKLQELQKNSFNISIFENINIKSMLIKKAINEIIIKSFDSLNQINIDNIINQFLSTYEILIKISIKSNLNYNIEEFNLIYLFLDSFFLPFIIKFSNSELKNHFLFKKIVEITKNTDPINFILIFSFFKNLLDSNHLSCNYLINILIQEFPEIDSNLINSISILFKSFKEYESIKYNEKKIIKNNFLQDMFKKINIQKIINDFLIYLFETSFLDSHLYLEFFENFILMQLNYITNEKSNIISDSLLEEMSQIKNLLITSFNKNIILSCQTSIKLLNLLLYSLSNLWFEDISKQKLIIPIIDVIFLNCKENIKNEFENEIYKLKEFLLSNIFNLGSCNNNLNISINKLVILLDRNLQFYKLEDFNTHHFEDHIKKEFLNKLKILFIHLTELLINREYKINNNSFETGFKIRDFLKIYSEIDFKINNEIIKNKEILKNTEIDSLFALYVIKQLFVSQEFIKLLSDSKNHIFEKGYIIFNLNENKEKIIFLDSLIKELSEILISKKIILELKNFIYNFKDTNKMKKDKIYYEIISSFRRKLESDFLIYLFDLFDNKDLKLDFIQEIFKDSSNHLLKKISQPILIDVIKYNNLSSNNKELFNSLKEEINIFFENILDFSIINKDYLKISDIINMIILLLEDDIFLKDRIYLKINNIIILAEKLAEDLNNWDLNLRSEYNCLFLICEILTNLILIIERYFEDNIFENEIQDNIDINFQSREILISRFLIKLFSSIHYLIGKILELSIKTFDEYSKNNNINCIKNINEYTIILQDLIIESMKLSSKIYFKLEIYEDNLSDDLRFTSITVPMEINIFSMFDKLLGLTSTILNNIDDESIIKNSNIILEQMVRIERSEIVGNNWISSLLKSRVGHIKENAMEISRLLTTYSLKIHSSVLLILKEHNWYNVQYEYVDTESATKNIEKLSNCIKEFLISKNKDDIDDNEIYDEEIKINDQNNDEIKENICLYNQNIDNFEKGIYVIASHWKRLIGPSFSHQLLETYLSTIFVNSLRYNSISTNKNKLFNDISQRLGCWCFILPKLISDDFIICTNSENENIKTIEKNLTPCIESLLELNPLIVGEAIKEKKVDLKSRIKNDFIPSPIDNDDISICQALLIVIKNKDLKELTNEMILKSTTFNNLIEIKKISDINEIISKIINLPLVNVLIELAFQALMIIETSSIDEDFEFDVNRTKHSDMQTNWINKFKYSSNNERRILLTGNIEDILLMEEYSKMDQWNSNNPTFIWLLATRIILSLTIYFPRILREIWLCNSNDKVQKTLQKLILNYFSPIIIPIEISHIPLIVGKLSNSEKTITYEYNNSSRTVKIDYSERGFNATLNFTFSQSHPLVIPKINITNITGISKKQSSNWLVSVIKAIRYKNITHAILTWINNLSLYLDGIEDCLICYSIVHPQYRSLPKKRCQTCKNIFHNECIYKWFKTSNKTTCPLCISIM